MSFAPGFASGVTRHVVAAVTSAAAVGAVTGVVFALDHVAPVLSLGVLYVFAVLPAAVAWGVRYALAVSLASMLAFNWFLLPPRHTFHLADSQNWVALGVFLVTAVVVSELAARTRRREAEAEQRAREASVLAEAASSLLESGRVQDELQGIATRVARVVGARHGRIELESVRLPESHETMHEIVAGERVVGRLFLESSAEPDLEVRDRLVPALGSVLAVAIDRERLGRTALEAETLRRSDAIKTAILRAVSHDLRSPLTAIRAAAEGLQSVELELSAVDRAVLLVTIDAESRRLDRLVGDLLDLSRLEVGAAAPRPQLWTLEGLVGQALAELGPAAERVVVTFPVDLPPVRVDAAHIARVLVNLLGNALKYSSPTDPVELQGECRDGMVLVRVVDRGPGLDARELERVFDPFERGARVRGRGSGLGLAIAQGFAQANGGRVSVEPVARGGGSFVLALPAAPLPALMSV